MINSQKLQKITYLRDTPIKANEWPKRKNFIKKANNKEYKNDK